MTQDEIVAAVKRDPGSRRYDREIAKLPTISQGQFSNLKLEWDTPESEYRLWVSRMTREDGAKLDRAIELEHRYKDWRASWGWRTFERPNPCANEE